MAIRPRCDCKWCDNSELKQPGALLFGPLNQNGLRKKLHVCLKCFPRVRKKVLEWGQERPYPEEETDALLLSAPNRQGFVHSYYIAKTDFPRLRRIIGCPKARMGIAMRPNRRRK